MDKKMKYLKTYNESITQYLKPKPMEEVLKNIEQSDVEDIRDMLFNECDKKFQADVDLYNYLLDESIINKYILKYRAFKKFGYIPDNYTLIDLLNILNKEELIILSKKLWNKE